MFTPLRFKAFPLILVAVVFAACGSSSTKGDDIVPVDDIDEIAPVEDEGILQMDVAGPVVDEGSAVVDEGTPVVDEGTPVLDEGTPVLDEGTPVVDEGTPVVDEGTPVVDEGTVVVDEGAPVIDEGLPAPLDGSSTTASTCQPGDQLIVDIHSIAAPGDGCKPDGTPAQGDTTQTIELVDDGAGGLTPTLIQPDPTLADYSLQFGSVTDTEQGCLVTAHFEIGIFWPNDQSAGGMTTESMLIYDHTIEVAGTSLSGTGEITTRWLGFPDANDLDQDTAYDLNDPCSEPLDLNGVLASP